VPVETKVVYLETLRDWASGVLIDNSVRTLPSEDWVYLRVYGSFPYPAALSIRRYFDFIPETV
jgi:hypothetical protein